MPGVGGGVYVGSLVTNKQNQDALSSLKRTVLFILHCIRNDFTNFKINIGFILLLS